MSLMWAYEVSDGTGPWVFDSVKKSCQVVPSATVIGDLRSSRRSSQISFGFTDDGFCIYINPGGSLTWRYRLVVT